MTADTPELDRLVWHTLGSVHRHFCEDDGLCRTFRGDVAPFIASRDDTPAALDTLGRMVNARPDRQFYLMQRDPVHLPDTVDVLKKDLGIQMVMNSDIMAPDISDDVQVLGEVDRSAVVELATLTEPGPFFERTADMGHFVGIYEDGQLVAMAGERLKIPGYSEVSAVCTHPDHRGKGLASTLIRVVAARMQGRGEIPFLHTYAWNEGAIRLYEHLGFEARCHVELAVIRASDKR